jgi:hypothetical protein
MRALFDNNMSRPLAMALKYLSKSVVHVRDIPELGPKALDEVIMPYAAEHGFVVVTEDLRQMDLAWFQPSLRKLGAAYVFIRGTKRKGVDLKAWELAKLVVKAWDEIERHAERNWPCFTALVKPSGFVTTYKKK